MKIMKETRYRREFLIEVCNDIAFKYTSLLLTLGFFPKISNMVGMFLREWHVMNIMTIRRDILASLCSLLRNLDSVLLLTGTCREAGLIYL